MFAVLSAAPQCFSFCLRGIVRIVLRGRDVVPHFDVSSGSVDFRCRMVHLPSFGGGAVLLSLLGVSDVDTFHDAVLVVILAMIVALSVDVASQVF